MTVDEDRAWVGSMPEAYQRGLGPTFFEPYAADLARRAAALAPRRVLELAAGTGIATRALVEALPDAAVTATDLNAAMVGWGARAVPGATWQQADAQELAFPDDAFDLVAGQFGVMFFPDRARAYAEARRVLAPGGHLLFSTWDDAASHAYAAALTSALHRLLPQDTPTFVTDIPHGYHDRDQVRADVLAAGFDPVEVETVTLTGHAPSAAAVAAGFCRGTPLRAALEARGDLVALTAAIAEAMTAELGAGPVSGEMRAHVVTAAAG